MTLKKLTVWENTILRACFFFLNSMVPYQTYNIISSTYVRVDFWKEMFLNVNN